jgi:outer membrane protein assembly factor BamB
MSWNARRASIVLLALFLVISAYWMERVQAQLRGQIKGGPIPVPVDPKPPLEEGPNGVNPAVDPDGFLNNGIQLLKDEKGRGKAIEAAIDYIADEDWATAIEQLQKLLEINEDVFVRLKRKNGEGKEIFVWVSAKREADRLIGSMPEVGRDLYRAKFNEKAAGLLKQAKKNGDPSLLNDIMKLYAHTEAGKEAIKLLADYKFDRGEYMPALLCYSKLIHRLGEEKTPTTILAKAAWAAHLAPPSSSGKNTITASAVYSEKELWNMLKGRTREVQFGEQALSPEELQDYVAKLDRSRLEQNASDSMIYRATPSRGNQLVGGPAFMTREWSQPMLSSSDGADAVRQQIRQVKSALKNQGQPIVPSFAPITLTATGSKGDKIPLLIYKDYFGITARDLRTGNLSWFAHSDLSLQGLLSSSDNKSAVGSWLGYYQNQHPQMIFENSTYGTLSTDGQFVYSVEDLAVPPQPQMNGNPMFINPGMNPNIGTNKNLETASSHSTLQAFSLDKNSGKLTWIVGTDSEKDPLTDHFFLGPPLPLAGKIFVLAEKQQEIRLICLETVESAGASGPLFTPRVVSMQTLGLAQEKMRNDPLRRTAAAHLAYSEGILVCPTNAGAVFGVNLLENSLAWAYPYREKSDGPPQQRFDRWGRPIGPWNQPGMPQPNTPHQNPWKNTAPVISDGKIVFAAPDARSLHCINLRDGSLVWRKNKQEDDLYLGNVYNGFVVVVGKKYTRGLNLATGDIAWTLETGMPSGQGIGSDNVYYLPVLGKDDSGKESQILGIDMERGRIVSRSKSRPRQEGKEVVYDTPGNLLFHDGKVVSLTAEEVAVYPQLKARIAEMDEQIGKNPNDPVALTERGDLRLDKGDLPGAIDDLTTALQNNPTPELRARARAKLYDTLTAYVADHFNDAEKYLKDYEELCKIDISSAPENEREKLQIEQRRRRATYLWLVGKGRQDQGRLVEAFEKYQEFAAAAGKQSELVPAVDDSQVKAAPDVWARGRIADMMQKAKPEERQPLEKLIADRWDKLRQTNDLNELRSFVRTFGSVSSAGKEARLELAERLMEQKDSGEEHPLLEAELELNQFRTGRHAPELAARATESLARLYTRKGLLEDAAYCYRKLASDYAKIVVRNGKTGQQIYEDDAATDKRLIPYLDDPQPLGSIKKFKSTTKNGDAAMPGGGQLFQFEHSGEKLPYFRHHIVGLRFIDHAFMLLDRNLEDDNQSPKEVWTERITSSGTAFEVLARSGFTVNVFNPQFGMVSSSTLNAQSRFSYSTSGHLIVLPLGDRVFGFDPVHHRKLWERNLLEKGGPVHVHTASQAPMWNPQTAPVVDPRDGSMLLTYNDGWYQRIGQVSPFDGTICVQTRDTLSVLDPLTGRTLWSRLDVHSRNFLFADEEYVFVVELDNQNQPSGTRVFRASDGMTVKAPDFASKFEKRVQLFGRYLLLAENGASNEVLVRLYDMATGEDVWKQKYAARSIIARGEDASLAGVVEPDGKVHVLDLNQRKEVFSAQMSELSDHKEKLKNVQRYVVLADRINYYFAPLPVEQNGPAPVQFNTPSPNNVMTQLGMRTVPVNGWLLAFNRNKEDQFWHECRNQYLILDQFQESPLLFLTARTGQAVNPAFNGMPQGPWTPHVTSIHKTQFAVVFNEDLPNSTQNVFGLRIDPRLNTVELLTQRLKIVHYPASTDKKGKPAAQASPKQDNPAAPARLETRQSGVRSLPLERARIREIAVPPLPPGR